MIVDRLTGASIGGVRSAVGEKTVLVTGMQRGWRAWTRRQWPLAVLLVVLLAGDLETARGLPFAQQWWALPDVIVMAGLALVAPRWPIGSAVGHRDARMDLGVVDRRYADLRTALPS